MQKNIIYILTLLISSAIYGQKIKTITEFRKDKDSLIKNRKTEFNKNGNLIKEVRFGGFDPVIKTFRNNIRIVKYDNKKKVSEYHCEDFVAKDTCVMRSFTIYEYDLKNNIERQIKYEPDSLIRFIRDIKMRGNMRITKTSTWEFSPVKEPNFETALILTDTSYFDEKKRLIKQINYNSKMRKPYIKKYTYSENKYTLQTIGTFRDTVLTFEYNKSQQKFNNQNIDYTFNSSDNYEYEFKYY